MTKNDSLLKRIGSGALDLIYPMSLYCISCGKIIDSSRTYRLCNECMGAASWTGARRCAKCGRPLAENDPGERCFACSSRDAGEDGHSFDKGHACAGYGTVEQAVIFAFKYGSRSDIGSTLGEIMFDRMASEYGEDVLAGMYDLVMPVPVSSAKKKKRGYNHAALMAGNFAERAGLVCDSSTVIRTRDTAPMKGLRPVERRANIRGAFEIRERRREKLRGSSVLLVDDIFTTGATIDEIASLLKQAGAARVDFLAYAGGADMIVS